MLLGALDVCYDHRLAVAAERVSQEVRKRCLSVRNVIPLPIRESEDHLLQIRQTLVDVSSLDKLASGGVGLLGPLGSGQVDKMKL